MITQWELFSFLKGLTPLGRTVKQRLLSGSSQCPFDGSCCPPLVSHTLFFPLLQCTTCRSKQFFHIFQTVSSCRAGFMYLCIMSICQGQDTWSMHTKSPRNQQNPCFSFGVTSLGRSWQCDRRSLQTQMMHGVTFWVLKVIKDLW